MKTWDDMMPLVVPYLSGVPDISVKMALSRAATDFFARTQLWREELQPVSTVEGRAEVALTPPSQAKVESVLWVMCGVSELVHTDARFVAPALVTQVGSPRFFWIVDDSRIHLHPIPDAAYPVRVMAALKPDTDTDEVEDWIFDTWADALADGAIWYLADIPNKHWSDAALAQTHKIRFDRAIANARVRDLRQINLRVRPRGF
jgi:hypothetical protein